MQEANNPSYNRGYIGWEFDEGEGEFARLMANTSVYQGSHAAFNCANHLLQAGTLKIYTQLPI